MVSDQLCAGGSIALYPPRLPFPSRCPLPAGRWCVPCAALHRAADPQHAAGGEGTSPGASLWKRLFQKEAGTMFSTFAALCVCDSDTAKTSLPREVSRTSLESSNRATLESLVESQRLSPRHWPAVPGVCPRAQASGAVGGSEAHQNWCPPLCCSAGWSCCCWPCLRKR